MAKEILAVDDDQDFRELLINILGSEGYDVCAVSSGQEAIEEAKKGLHPSLILIDYLMPKMDGVQTIRELRKVQACNKVPFIFVTAYSDIKQVPEVTQLQPQGIIIKPFEIEELFSKVKTCLS